MIELATFLPLVAITGVCAYQDLKKERIPNSFTYGGILLGLGLGIMGYGPGMLSRAVGLAVLALPALGLYAARGLGGGDVKLLGAVGALSGYPFALDVGFLALVAGFVGAILHVIVARRVRRTARELFVFLIEAVTPGVRPGFNRADARIPLGVAVFAGTLAALLVPALRITPRLLSS